MRHALVVGYLIDGFPRKLDQCDSFESTVVPCKCVCVRVCLPVREIFVRFCIFFNCTEEELERRLLERGATSGKRLLELFHINYIPLFQRTCR